MSHDHHGRLAEIDGEVIVLGQDQVAQEALVRTQGGCEDLKTRACFSAERSKVEGTGRGEGAGAGPPRPHLDLLFGGGLLLAAVYVVEALQQGQQGGAGPLRGPFVVHLPGAALPKAQQQQHGGQQLTGHGKPGILSSHQKIPTVSD